MTDATTLISQLRSRQVSAVEAVQEAIGRIDRLNSAVNAVVTTNYDNALDRARLADRRAAKDDWSGPLHGVPILIKDLFDFRAGLRNTFGCRATREFVPDFTVAHVARLEEAGAIVLGKTNTPEFGHKGVTDNLLFGPTRCPFDLCRNAGGSSGGSAAAVATGMVPLAQGSDAGGSIRIPAAWCGVVGFKPTFGRIPNTGSGNAFGLHAPFVHAGPLARTVRDAALMAQVMFGPHPDDPFCLPHDGCDLLAALSADTRGLRIAYSADLGVFAVDPDVAETVDACLSSLAAAELGVERPEFELPLDQDALAELWLRQVGVMYLEMFSGMGRGGLDFLDKHPDDIPPAIHHMVAAARQSSALDVRRDEVLRTQIWQAVQRIFAEYDVLLTPTVTALPVSNAADGTTQGPARVGGRAVEPSIGWCMTHPFNFTGHPAASVPAGLAPGGLPVGLQVVGRRFADEQVIALCRRIEEIVPWQRELEAVAQRLVAGADSAVG